MRAAGVSEPQLRPWHAHSHPARVRRVPSYPGVGHAGCDVVVPVVLEFCSRMLASKESTAALPKRAAAGTESDANVAWLEATLQGLLSANMGRLLWAQCRQAPSSACWAT